jgi:hypothetical protein
MNIRKDLERKKGNEPFKSSIQFVSTFVYDPKTRICTTHLSKSRVEQWIKQGYEAAIVNVGCWKVQSFRVPCSAMRDVGDVDRWDKDIPIRDVKGRRLTNEQEFAWKADPLDGTLSNDEAVRMSQGMDALMGLMSDLGPLPSIPGMPPFPFPFPS